MRFRAVICLIWRMLVLVIESFFFDVRHGKVSETLTTEESKGERTIYGWRAMIRFAS